MSVYLLNPVFIHKSSFFSLPETRPLQAGPRDGHLRVRLLAGLPGRRQTAGSDGGLLLADQPGLPCGPVGVEGGAAPSACSSAAVCGVAEEDVPATSAGQAAGLQHSQAERQSGRTGTVSVDAWCVFSSMFICLRISALVLSGLVPLNRKMHEWKLDKYNY